MNSAKSVFRINYHRQYLHKNTKEKQKISFIQILEYYYRFNYRIRLQNIKYCYYFKASTSFHIMYKISTSCIFYPSQRRESAQSRKCNFFNKKKNHLYTVFKRRLFQTCNYKYIWSTFIKIFILTFQSIYLKQTALFYQFGHYIIVQ